jgi:hypothetical protein
LGKSGARRTTANGGSAEGAADARGRSFRDAQEATVDDLKISVVSIDGAKASVLADFDRGGGEREKLTYSLILEKGLWRVHDIACARANEPASTLRGLFSGK